VVSERQIAANRRNAAKSTGPRSTAGKDRARLNALSHGLTRSPAAEAETAQAVEDLARQIVGQSDDFFMLVQARVVAETVVQLARIRWVKIALIERALSLGTIGPPSRTQSASTAQDNTENEPMSEANAELVTMAVLHALPELRRIHRYERRASARQHQALRELIRRKSRRDADLRAHSNPSR
jgi:hypothetical protein